MKKLLVTATFLLVMHLNYAQGFTFEKNEQGAWIKEDGEKVLFYQAQTKSQDGTFPRADYIHPLYNVNGKILTEDFPRDHLHHRGIFWTWHQVLIGDRKMGDAWECRDFVWDVQQFDQGQSDLNSLTLIAHTLWKSPLWKDDQGDMKPFVKAKTAITVHSKMKNYRVIDFEISLLALEPNLKIGGSEDKKGYGGFSVRMKMPDDLKFTSSHGKVEPQTLQLDAGSWMDISGSLNNAGQKEGIVIICNPGNPMYPEKWILRKSGSMQNPVYPGRAAVAVSMETPTVLKYRLVTYVGDLEKPSLEMLIENYH
jgi:hypothetical protein